MTSAKPSHSVYGLSEKFDLLQQQIADQKWELAEQKKKKVYFKADLLQKLFRELAAENPRSGQGHSVGNVPC